MKLPFVAAVLFLLAAAPVRAALPPPAPDDWRTIDADNTLVIDTNQGQIIVELAPQFAPASVERLKALTRAHVYDGRTFFRVIDDFMAQTGDPTDTGQGQSKEPNLPAEFTFRVTPGEAFTPIARSSDAEGGFIGAMPVASQPAAAAVLMMDGKVQAWGMFCAGVLGMARADDPDSANSQFFLMRQTRNELNRNYAAVGRVLVGEDVVRKIKVGEPVAAPQDRMTSVRVLSDIPEAQRPQVRVIDTKSAYFDALVAQAQAVKGPDFSPCDVDLPAEAK